MAYCTVDDVKTAAGGDVKLRELSDLNADGAINEAVVNAVIAKADAWIDSYARKRYLVPFSPVPAMIASCSAEETVYRLHAARYMVDDRLLAAHEERERWLRDLARGIVSPGVEPNAAPGAVVMAEVVVRDENEDISRESLKGFA